MSNVCHEKLNVDSCSQDDVDGILNLFLPEKRIDHCKRVASTASRLAVYGNVCRKSAFFAGLVHDIAKYLDPISIARWGVVCTTQETVLYGTHRPIWHALVAPKLLDVLFDSLSDEVMDAVQYHSTGKPNMAPLSELLFVSDYIEPHRRFSDCSFIESLMMKSFVEGVFALSYSTLRSLQKRQLPVHELTRHCYVWYKSKLGKETIYIEDQLKELL